MSYDKLLFDVMFPSRALAVTPNDSVDLTKPGRIYVGGAGAVNVDTIGGDTIAFAAVPAGTFLPVRVKRVRATGTAATNLVVVFNVGD
jgi:hypothetical protein